MGKGSTKNERKVNPTAYEIAKKGWLEASQELKQLQALTLRERPPEYDELLRLAKGRKAKALARMKRSPNDTQTGKRGAK